MREGVGEVMAVREANICSVEEIAKICSVKVAKLRLLCYNGSSRDCVWE